MFVEYGKVQYNRGDKERTEHHTNGTDEERKGDSANTKSSIRDTTPDDEVDWFRRAQQVAKTLLVCAIGYVWDCVVVLVVLSDA